MGAVPTFGGYLLQRADRPDQTGVVEGDVETAEFADRARDQRSDVGLGCDVGLLENGAASILLALTTVDAPPSSLRSATTTAAPSPAKRIAVARPIPLAAPVITATLLSSLPITMTLLDSAT